MPLAISKDRWSQMFDGSAPVDAVHSTSAMESNAACGDKEKYAHWERKSRQATPTSHTLIIAQVNGEAQILLELADHIFVRQVEKVANYLAGLVTQNELHRKFRELANTWEEETSLLSSPTEAAQHPAYQEIIKMGIATIPLILKRMKEQGGHWFWALSLLTGEDPVPRKSRGKVSAMRSAWLKWGSKRGYC